ncbi:MAG: chromate transporter [Eubacteriales bacterium]
MIYLTLFYEFFKIGLFAVGGGMATIPFLIDLAGKYDWYTTAEFANMVAISQSTPGPVGINMATYAGYEAAGILGGFIATIGLVTPAFFVITIIAKFMANFSENKIVKAVFSGLRPVVVALILLATWELCLLSFFITNSDGSYTPILINIIIGIALFGLMQIKRLKKLHPLWWVLIGALLGIILQL